MIDTSVWVDLERSSLQPTDIALIFPDEEFAVAALTLSELLLGASYANTVERRQRREAFADRVIGNINVISFDVRVARQYASTLFRLGSTGQVIDVHDLQLAATALAHGLTVLTKDLRDFTRVPGLDVQVFGI